MEQLLNEVTPTWQEETPLPEPLMASASVAYNDKIYVFGGKPANNGTAVNKVWILDCASGVWAPGANMLKAVEYATAVVIKNKAYIIDFTSVQIYNLDENTWSTGEVRPKQLYLSAVVAAGSRIYTFGSSTGIDTYIYDTIQDTWQEGIPQPGNEYGRRSGARAEILGNKIYVMGGEQPSSQLLKTTDIFDINTNEWSNGYPMPYQAKFFSSTTAGNKIYIVGGEIRSLYSNQVAYFDPKEGKWTMLSSLNTGTHSLVVACVGSKLYAIGGGSDPNGDRPAKAAVFSLEIGSPDGMPAPESLSVLLNTSEQVQLSVSQDLADNTELTWTSSADSVATVDANGKVTALIEGLTYINAKNTDETFNESIPVRVFPGTADESRLAVHLTVGQKQKLYLADDPSTVTWEAVDESIATVDAVGKVTAVSKGLAIVKGWIAGKEYQIYVRVSE